MLWLYLAISAAFSAGFMTCGLLTWRSREQERRMIRARLDMLSALVQNEIEDRTHHMKREGHFADQKSIRRHIIN